MIGGGYLAATVGPDVEDEDCPGGKRRMSPREHFLTRVFGVATMIAGVALVVATLLGLVPPPTSDGPTF
jgi:hypothetical protein